MKPNIEVHGARVHNLKNISLSIPRGQLSVFTGLSGSGKSSLAFDTIFAEGQRRYMESLSSYARQFLDQMDKPDVDAIEGLSPAISIDQKSTNQNPRSTVGTITEIYDYLRLLYASIGVPQCPGCGEPIQGQSIDEMCRLIHEWPADTMVTILAPLITAKKGEHRQLLAQLQQEGFTRVRVNQTIHRLDEAPALDKKKAHTIDLVVDRLALESDQARLVDSLETGLRMGKGMVLVESEHGERRMSERMSCPHCQISIPEITHRLFSFNSPLGACPTCKGIGECHDFDEALVFPFTDRPLVSAINGLIDLTGSYYQRHLTVIFGDANLSMATPYSQLPAYLKTQILYGDDASTGTFPATGRRTRRTRYGHQWRWPGIISVLRHRYSTASETYRQAFHPYMRAQPCDTCKGSRLKPDAMAVTVHGHPIHAITNMNLTQLLTWITTTPFGDQERAIASKIHREIESRVRFLTQVGLGYLSLDRKAGSLSGGEAQRIRLATQIGAGLTGVLYVLDEPSIGLHQRDNQRLIDSLLHLRDLGNTLVVVEHDEDMIRQADYIVDIGPGAGPHGGNVVYAGPVPGIMTHSESITGHYLSGTRAIAIPDRRRPYTGAVCRVVNASAHNLQHITVDIPLGQLVVVTGVSGSGKSTLINDTLHAALSTLINRSPMPCGAHDAIEGWESIDKLIPIDQSPIGRTPRSNPATYTGLFTPIRELFASTREAKMRGYGPGRFSFNVKGGRCETCEGDGVLKIEMHFLPDVYVTCDVCKGHRYNDATLAVQYKGHRICDVLDMTVDHALTLFEAVPAIYNKLKTLHDVGLGYIQLGQSATTLSGGEAQRIKLAKELSKRGTGNTLYMLDEPTTGLHFADIDLLLGVLHRMVDAGNTVVIIEHNLDVIKTADHVIDLGPEGGPGGGHVVAQGRPEDIATHPDSLTGRYLAPLLTRQAQTSR